MVLSRWCLKRGTGELRTSSIIDRKRFEKADGQVVKDVDVSLISNRGRGKPARSRMKPRVPVLGDPMYFKLAVRRAP